MLLFLFHNTIPKTISILCFYDIISFVLLIVNRNNVKNIDFFIFYQIKVFFLFYNIISLDNYILM